MSSKKILAAANSLVTATVPDLSHKSIAPGISTTANATANMLANGTTNNNAINSNANSKPSTIINSTVINSTANHVINSPPRRQFTRQRRQLTTNQRQQSARDASRYLTKLQRCLPAQARIGLYYDGFGELPTQPILDWCQRLGYQPYLPVVGSLGNEDKRLRFVPIYHTKLLNIPTRIHNLGMQQNHHRRLLWAQELDVLICPLTAVDHSGNRMGMGGGFYDATLAKSYQSGYKKPLKIGWCYDFQVVEQLARQPWDVPLDGLITPNGIRWF